MVEVDEGAIRRRLQRLLRATEGAQNVGPAAWYDGDPAGKQKTVDNWKAGRLFWKSARNFAEIGLAALDKGDVETAVGAAWEATEHYLATLESRLRPSDFEDLERRIKKRGRPLGARSKKGRPPQTK
jgi:hypothetical protein